MARRNVNFIRGGYYHVYNRGVNRELIFRCEQNYKFLEQRIAQYAYQYEVSAVAFCLMPNHYHMILRQDGMHPLSEFIQAVFNSYSKAFNKMFNRTGTMFEGPFRANAITGDEYLIHVCRYVHRNPLEAHLVSDLRDWPHSNYLEWIARRDRSFVDLDFVSAHFAPAEAYETFVLEYLPTKQLERSIHTLACE